MNDQIVIKTSKTDANTFWGSLSSNSTEVLSQIGMNIGEIHIACRKESFTGSNEVEVTEFVFENGVWRPVDSSTNKKILKLEEITSIYSRTPLPQDIQTINCNLLIANNPQLRAFGDKAQQIERIPGNFRIPTWISEKDLAGDHYISDFQKWREANNLQANNIWVVKSALGLGGKYVLLCNDSEIIDAVTRIQKMRENKKEAQILIQPYLNPKDLSEGKDLGIREIRIFCTAKRTSDVLSTRHSIFGRRMPTLEELKLLIDGENYDEWEDIIKFPIVEESIPQLNQIALQVTKDFADGSNSNICFIAIDLIFHNNKWYIVEVNTKDPLYPTQKNMPEISKSISSNIANMLLRNHEQ